jgi:1-acyl-sn-glycerol-3-phosphate acyltransferase
MIWESTAFRSRGFRLSWYSLNLLFSSFFDWRVEGRENIPRQGPLIIASNHIALIDPPYIGSCVPREIAFMAKRELFRHPALRALIAYHNAFPIRRGGWDSQAFRLLREKLDLGLAVLVFPEGTRSKTEDFLDPKPGIGLILKQYKVPVIPLYIAGTNLGLKTLLSRKRPLLARFGSLINPEEFDTYPSGKEGYTALSRMIMERIANLKRADNHAD